MIWYIISAIIIYLLLRHLYRKWHRSTSITNNSVTRRMPMFKSNDSHNSFRTTNQTRRSPSVSTIDNPLYYPHCPIQGCHNTNLKNVVVKKGKENFECLVCNYTFGKPKIIK